VWSRLTGIPKIELPANRERVERLLDERGYSNLFIVNATPGSRKEFQRVIEQHEPDVAVINQIRNIRVGGLKEGKVNQLEQAACDARLLAKKNNIVVVSVTQAGDSATDKDVLTMSDIDNSKTGMPGQADLIVGIGASPITRTRGMRCMSTCKNKFKENSSEDFFYVDYDPFLDRMESL
jgi:hypothetical protein